MTTVASDDWERYRQKLVIDYPQAVLQGEKYAQDYLALWIQFFITQHGVITATEYIQKMYALALTLPASSPMSSQISPPPQISNPQLNNGMVQRTFTLPQDQIVITMSVKSYVDLTELRDKQDARRKHEREAKARVRDDKLQQLAQERSQPFIPPEIKPYKSAIVWDRIA